MMEMTTDASMHKDPYKLATELVLSTRRIINRLEKEWPKSDEPRDHGASLKSELNTYQKLKTAECKEVNNETEKVGNERSKKSTRRSKTELNNMIDKLEKEIETLKLANEIPAFDVQVNPDLTLLDIVSSENSSPVKKCIPKSTSSTYVRPSTCRKSEPSKTLPDNVTYRIPGVKKKILKTERIMERGYRTAQDLNRNIELIKRPPVTKDASLQVSLPDEAEDERAIAENLTTFLIEQPLPPVSASLRNGHNVHQLIVNATENTHRKTMGLSRLTVQKMPESIIPKALSRQSLPSLQIYPDPELVLHGSDNVKVCVINHCSSTENKQPSVPSVKSLRPSQSVASSLRSSFHKNVDIGLQTDISQNAASASSDEKVVLEGHISDFVEVYKQHQTDIQFRRHALEDLASKVRASGRKCEKFKKKLPLCTSPLYASKMSTDTDGSGNEVYRSDFELESLLQEENVECRSSNYDGELSNDDVKASDSSSVRIKQASPNPKSPSPIRDQNESLIEMQMKRLGMSPERVLSCKRTSPIIERSTSVHKKKKVRKRIFESVAHEDSNMFYTKSHGKYVPIKPMANSNVQVIVPEIVVRLPETKSCEKSRSAPSKDFEKTYQSERIKRDQFVQTDEGCATMTSCDTSSVVDKINEQFERTQFLLNKMSGNGLSCMDFNPRTVLSHLHKRLDKEDYWSPTRSSGMGDSGRSPGEIGLSACSSHRSPAVRCPSLSSDLSIGEK